MYSGALLILAAYAGASAAQSAEDLDDAAVRLQYAFYTADVRALQEVLSSLDALGVSPQNASMKSYFLAYGHWRLALLNAAQAPADHAGAAARAASLRAARDCVRHAQAATSADARLAEAYAILAACGGFSADAPGHSRCRSGPLRTAGQLAPGNPRVLLLRNLCTVGADTPAAWREVVAAFEAAPPRTAGRPDWGHAESLALLGASFLRHGEPLAAREALERALVLAPDFREAQELLRTAAMRQRQ